jgi:hypothetical protein
VEFSKFVPRLGRNLLRLFCRKAKLLKGQLVWSRPYLPEQGRHIPKARDIKTFVIFMGCVLLCTVLTKTELNPFSLMYRNFKLQAFNGQFEVPIHIFALFLSATNDKKCLEICNFTVANFMIIRNNGLQNKYLL